MKRAKRTKAARECLGKQIRKHCRKSKHHGKCESLKGRSQAVAIAFSICRRQGFKV